MAEEPSTSEGSQEPDTNDPENISGESTASADTSAENLDANDPENSSTSDGEPDAGSGDAKGPQTTLEAVEAALKVDKGDQASSAYEGSGEAPDPAKSKEPDAKKEGEGDAEAGDKGEEDKPPPFHEHPRWKAVVADRDDWKTRAEKAEGETERRKPDLEAMDRIVGHLETQNLSSDEFNRLLVIGGHVKNDPMKALEALTPLYNRLLEVTGHTLPPDLQQAVEQGLTTEDYARQTARARADANIATFQSQTQGQKHEVERQAAEHTALTQSLSDTASAWEREWQASDPDYPKKVSLVRKEVELAFHRNEVERTPEAVRVMLDKVRKQVETELRAFLPKQRAVNSKLASDGSGGTSTPKKPETLMDAIDMALAG